MRPAPRHRASGALGLLVSLAATGCGRDPTGTDDPFASEIVLDLSSVLGSAQDQETLRSVVAGVELVVDGDRQTRDITGAETQVAFDVSLAPGNHDFEARVVSNTDVVLAEGMAADVPVGAAGFQVPIQMSAVTGVLFVLPGEVGVGGSSRATIVLQNRGSEDLFVGVGPLSPPADSCGGTTPCVSVFGFEGPLALAPGGSRTLSAHAGPLGQTTFSLRLTTSVGFVDLPITVTTPGTGTITVAVEAVCIGNTVGSPASGRTVLLEGPLSRSGTTNNEGRVTFTDVPLGSWMVRLPNDEGTPLTLSYGGDVAFVLLRDIIVC